MVAWYFLVAISAALMSTSTIVEKFALKAEHASAYSSDATLLIAVISLILIPFANFHVTLWEVALIYIMSLTSTTTYLLTARTYKHADVSAASPIISTLPPIFTVLLAFLFLHEGLYISQYLFIGALAVLAYLLLFKKSKDAKVKYFERGLYINYLFVTTLLMAVGAILTKYILSLGVSIITLFVIIGLSVAFNMFIYMTIKYGGIKEMGRNLAKHPLPLITTSSLALGYRLTYYAAASTAFISLVSPLRQSINIVVVVLAGAIIFKESDVVRKIAISMMMFACVYFIINPITL